MSFFSMTTMALGVVVSVLSGLVCYMGSGPLSDKLSWLPESDLVLSHPGLALAVGGFLVALSFLAHPSRIQ